VGDLPRALDPAEAERLAYPDVGLLAVGPRPAHVDEPVTVRQVLSGGDAEILEVVADRAFLGVEPTSQPLGIVRNVLGANRRRPPFQ
jgi:hypothetical protein